MKTKKKNESSELKSITNKVDNTLVIVTVTHTRNDFLEVYKGKQNKKIKKNQQNTNEAVQNLYRVKTRIQNYISTECICKLRNDA